MALNFPNNPTLGQIYTENDKSFIWNGSVWLYKNEYLEIKTAIANAINEKGGSVTTATPFHMYPNAITELSGGGEGVTPNGILKTAKAKVGETIAKGDFINYETENLFKIFYEEFHGEGNPAPMYGYKSQTKTKEIGPNKFLIASTLEDPTQFGELNCFLNIKSFTYANNDVQVLQDQTDSLDPIRGNVVDLVNFGELWAMPGKIIFGVLYYDDYYGGRSLKIKFFAFDPITNLVDFNFVDVTKWTLVSESIAIPNDLIVTPGTPTNQYTLVFQLNGDFGSYDTFAFKLFVDTNDETSLLVVWQNIILQDESNNALTIQPKGATIYNGHLYFVGDSFGTKNLILYKYNWDTQFPGSNPQVLNLSINQDDYYGYVNPFIDMKVSSTGIAKIFYHKINGYSSTSTRDLRSDTIDLNTLSNLNIFTNYSTPSKNINILREKTKLYYNFNTNELQLVSTDSNLDLNNGYANIFYAYINGNNLQDFKKVELNSLISLSNYTDNIKIDFLIVQNAMFIARGFATEFEKLLYLHFSENYKNNALLLTSTDSESFKGIVTSDANQNGFFDYYVNV